MKRIVNRWLCLRMAPALFAGATFFIHGGTAAVAQNSYSTPLPNAKASLTLTLVSPEIVRIHISRIGANVPMSPVQIVRPQPACSDSFHATPVTGNPSQVLLTSSLLQIVAPAGNSANAAPLIIKDRHGKVLYDASAGVTAESINSRWVQHATLADGEEFFGGGLQFHSLAQRGKTKDLKVNADPKDDIGNSHAVTPFFMSTHGYGLFVNTTEYSHFDFGKTVAGELSFSTPDSDLDYYFLYGPSLREVVARYSQLTGSMQMPPRWGLGFWYRMKSDWKAEKATEVATKFRANNIACDVIGLEPAWQTQAYSCSYVWNHAQFPDPAGFVGDMRGKNFHLNLWEHAYVHPTSPIYAELKQKGLAADKEVWGGLVPDFTKAETTNVFKSLHKKEHIDIGVDGYKLDECDGSDYTGGWFFPDDTKFPSGLSGAQMHNVFGYLYQRSFHDMFESLGKRAYFLCRGSYAGGQAYPTAIYSDWYDFKDYVRAACNSGFSGQLWCPEVRQTDSTEEFVRRLQTMFFSPLAMINAWADGVTPWEKGPEVERIFRLYDDLRMQLIPELYSSFREMSTSGLPIVRPLAMDWPEDRNTHSIDDEFMYGQNILVAPVFSGNTRQVYLPAGEWADWWTGAHYIGGKQISVTAPLDRLPLFVRSGGIISMQPAMQYSDAQRGFALELRASVGSGATAIHTNTGIYDDDGDSLRYRSGEYTETRVHYMQKASSVELTFDPSHGNASPRWASYVLKLQGVNSQPATVTVNGKQSAAAQWNATTHDLTIPLPGAFQGKVHVQLKGK